LAETIVNVQQKFRLDVLHVHDAVPHATAALLARRILRQNGTPMPRIVTTLHGTDITLLANDKSMYSMIKYSIERSHGVTAVSQDLKNDTIRLLKTKKPIQVIYNFYTPKKPNKTVSSIRKQLGVRQTDFLAIHLSNLRPVKRIPDLLKIAALMKKHRNFKLLILAGESFVPYEPLAKKLKLNNLIVKNNIRDIENYINAADAGIYTSQTESFGMGILESMSFGKPVLATRVGGIPEVMRDGKDGYLLKLGDVKGFTHKLEYLMDNPGTVKKLGDAAALRAKQNFSASKIVNQYLACYRKTCGKK
jgi:N-acetyl-alpha-D-glucosaminyl L-malate synthase BshA